MLQEVFCCIMSNFRPFEQFESLPGALAAQCMGIAVRKALSRCETTALLCVNACAGAWQLKLKLGTCLVHGFMHTSPLHKLS